MRTEKGREDLGKLLKQRRLMVPLTLRELATSSGTSPSHLVRIEKGQRFPSASILQKLAHPLGFEESELMRLAGYLSYAPAATVAEDGPAFSSGKIDPYVYNMLSRESPEIQQVTVGLLSIFKAIARYIK